MPKYEIENESYKIEDSRFLVWKCNTRFACMRVNDPKRSRSDNGSNHIINYIFRCRFQIKISQDRYTHMKEYYLELCLQTYNNSDKRGLFCNLLGVQHFVRLCCWNEYWQTLALFYQMIFKLVGLSKGKLLLSLPLNCVLFPKLSVMKGVHMLSARKLSKVTFAQNHLLIG